MFCTRVAWVCLVCLLLCKEEGSSPVSAITEKRDMGLYEVLLLSTHSHPCGSGAFSLEKGRIAPLPLPRHVVRGDYLECLAM